MNDLPIDAARARFARAIAAGKPVVVAAPTGSGKSTRLPLWLSEGGDRVLVVEPRRVACRALACWLAQQRGEQAGESIGYRVRFDDRGGTTPRILFVTPGVALNMIADGSAWRFSRILIDEFHERGWEVDLCLALARKQNAPLCLCSATLDTEQLTARLQGTAVVAKGRAFPVDVEYTGTGPPSTRDLAERVDAAVRTALGSGDGDTLVFLPGRGEIERCAAVLSDLREEVVAVHGGVQPAELTRAFRAGPRRRVFLATNVAETSLTIPGVTVVIDSGLVRMRLHQGGRSVLALVPASRAATDQRAGRAGRVRPGTCVRLWAKSFEPVAATPPEVERIELDDLVLRAGICGLDGEELVAAPWVTPLPEFALAQARERLASRGALDASGRVTAFGRAQARLPVSGLCARILADAPAELAGALADLAAVVDVGRDLLLVPRQDRVSIEAARAELFAGAKDEMDVQLRCLRSGDARRHCLRATALKEARRIAATLSRELGAKPGEVDRAKVIAHLLRRIPDAAFVRRERGRKRPADRKPWGNGTCEVMLADYRVPGLSEDRAPPPAEAGLLLEDEWLGTGRGARGVGRLLLRCTIADLRRAGLGEWVARNPRLEKGRRITAEVERVYAGVTLDRGSQPLRGAPLCQAVATFILADRLRKGLGVVVADAFHHLKLVAQVGKAEPLPHEDAAAYLCARLIEHGVDTLADLALLEDHDVLPDVEAFGLELGLSAREVASLAEDFPREWIFPGGRYRCDVDVSRRLVAVEPVAADHKGDPPVRFLPRFRGFAVELRKASRRLRLR